MVIVYPFFIKNAAMPVIANTPINIPILLFSIPYLKINGYIMDCNNTTPAQQPIVVAIIYSIFKLFFAYPTATQTIKVNITDMKMINSVAAYFDFIAFFCHLEVLI